MIKLIQTGATSDVTLDGDGRTLIAEFAVGMHAIYKVMLSENPAAAKLARTIFEKEVKNGSLFDFDNGEEEE